jgi:TP53 regulating kinase and related kinases
VGDAAMMHTLIKKGAEASLYLADWHGRRAIIKARLPKKYRPEQLDQTIRRYRTVHEPQLMHEAKRAGVPTPTIFKVDVENAAITMEYVEGLQVKQLIDALCDADREEICMWIGEEVGKLHGHGIVHGDLTTSNMILSGEGRIFLVDFGLGAKSVELEAQGVDLHLLRRALQSTHFQVADACFKNVLNGYASVVGADSTACVLEKVREIEKRGRYVTERKQDQ